MDVRPEQPPEGRLIADALTRTGLSIREASRRAGISYGRWRQITSGVQNVSPGSYAQVRAPADTLARMAAVVGVTPGQLRDAGRGDAADSLTRFPASPPGSYGRAITDLTDEEFEMGRAYIDGIRAARARREREEARRRAGNGGSLSPSASGADDPQERTALQLLPPPA